MAENVNNDKQEEKGLKAGEETAGTASAEISAPEAEEKPKTRRRRTVKKTAEEADSKTAAGTEKDTAAEEAEEKPKTRRRRTVKKAAEETDSKTAAEPEKEAAAEETEEKPKTRRRRTVKKTAEETDSKTAAEPEKEAASEEAEEKPKTRRRRTVKKTAEETDSKTAAEPEKEAASEEAEEKTKTRRRRAVKKAAEETGSSADAAEDSGNNIGVHKIVASGSGLVVSDSQEADSGNIDPEEAEKELLKARTERRRRSVKTAGRAARIRPSGYHHKLEDGASSEETAPSSGELIFSSFDGIGQDESTRNTPQDAQDHENAQQDGGKEERQESSTHQNGHGEYNHHKREHREYSPEERPEVTGILDIVEGGFGFLRFDNFMSSDQDIYVSPTQIRRFNLKTGDEIYGISRRPGQNEKFGALLYVKTVNGDDPGTAIHRPQFESLTPIFPNERLRLEGSSNDLSVRLIDLVAPIGKGQRGMIVAPPKAGKTTLLKSIARSLEENHPEVSLFVLLVDERPEEVTDMKRTLQHGQVIYSTFDEMPQHHVKVAEMMLARAKRLAEHGKDVVILLDSLTRLTRAYNLVVPASGRTLSGGIDPGAFYGPKRFFGAARNIENGGSITILATALVDTGSRMDDVIFEEFKGTGNMELHLDRKLSEKRIFPAIDIYKSGTRREELLMSQEELEAVWTMRRAMSNRSTQEVTEEIIDNLAHTRNNQDFIEIIRKVFYQEQK